MIGATDDDGVAAADRLGGELVRIRPAVVRSYPPGPDHERTIRELDERDGQSLFGFVRRLGLGDDQARDVVQEVLLRLWVALEAGEPIENPRAWAYRAGYRRAMDEHRWRRRVVAIGERLATRGGDERSLSDRIAVWTEVDRLPRRQREVLYLRYRSDLEFAEIGVVLGINASAARSHASQALATLRRRLASGET